MANNNQETLNRYITRIHYQTVCYSDYNIYAATPEEAEKKARDMFERENSSWGKNKRILKKIEVKR